MVRSLYTAATGMEAQQLYMDTISHNLSNVNTNSFKRQKVEFQDLVYESLREPGVANVEGSVAPSGLEVGLGVRPSATQRMFEQGSLNQTGNDLDIAIQGEGFFQVSLPDGTIGFTREGQWKLSNDGSIVTSSGYLLYPQITIPEGAQTIEISPQGIVTAKLPSESSSQEIGRIELAQFINSAGMKALGQNLFSPTDASGEPVVTTPTEQGSGQLLQGYVEASNVQIIDEMISMISAQRAYEIVSKAVSVSEEMMQVVNNLKR